MIYILRTFGCRMLNSLWGIFCPLLLSLSRRRFLMLYRLVVCTRLLIHFYTLNGILNFMLRWLSSNNVSLVYWASVLYETRVICRFSSCAISGIVSYASLWMLALINIFMLLLRYSFLIELRLAWWCLFSE